MCQRDGRLLLVALLVAQNARDGDPVGLAADPEGQGETVLRQQWPDSVIDVLPLGVGGLDLAGAVPDAARHGRGSRFFIYRAFDARIHRRQLHGLHGMRQCLP